MQASTKHEVSRIRFNLARLDLVGMRIHRSPRVFATLRGRNLSTRADAAAAREEQLGQRLEGGVASTIPPRVGR